VPIRSPSSEPHQPPATASAPPVRVTEDGGILTLEVQQPILSLELLAALAIEMDRLRDSRMPLVLCSAHETIFLAGAHLAEIARLDRHSSADYARNGRQVLDRFLRHPGPTVAAVHGPCTGGGLDLLLCCDSVVASPAARFGHPGIRRGLVTGWGGTVRLPGLAGPVAARTFLEAALVDAAAAAERGLVKLRTDPLAGAREEALRLAQLHPVRLFLWRENGRGNLVDRFRYLMVHKKMVQDVQKGGRVDEHQDLACR